MQDYKFACTNLQHVKPLMTNTEDLETISCIHRLYFDQKDDCPLMVKKPTKKLHYLIQEIVMFASQEMKLACYVPRYISAAC